VGIPSRFARTPIIGQTGAPPFEHVKSQLQILRSLKNLPALFIVRTISHGGRFPDDASQEALALMKLAVELGCEYIDVGITWPPFLTKDIRASKDDSMIIASYHDFFGDLRWTGQELQEKYLAADAIGGMSARIPLNGSR